VVLLAPRLTPRYPLTDDAFFRRLVKAAFAQRRKTLRNTLRGTGFDSAAIDKGCMVAGIDSERRGETLTLAEFAALADALGAEIMTEEGNS
jgi:16S rRNA (adenine1518-N6/adenine1519-N6)-dimethyltransferase